MTYNPIYLNAPGGNEIGEPLTKLKIHTFSECISLDNLADCKAGYNISCGLEGESKSVSLRSRTLQCCPLLQEGYSLLWEIVTHS